MHESTGFSSMKRENSDGSASRRRVDNPAGSFGEKPSTHRDVTASRSVGSRALQVRRDRDRTGVGRRSKSRQYSLFFSAVAHRNGGEGARAGTRGGKVLTAAVRVAENMAMRDRLEMR